MRSVGLKVLKSKLSEYVRIAASGEVVLVTDRDRVVAELGPPQLGRAAFLADAFLAGAVREGWVTPPALAGTGPPPRKPIMKVRDVLKDLEPDREDR
jgi:antitoxin (DNA-binding transcriptional repressor) of toxin-antitoxin stability system